MTQEAERSAANSGSVNSGGLVPAILCYGMWGFLPLYFHLVRDVGPLEMIAQRVLWSLLLLLVLIALRTGLGAFVDVLRAPRLMGPLTLSAALIASNWLMYIWAVNNHHVMAASLGYFLNPLLNILLGVVFLKERLRRGQVIAIALAALGVAILAAGALNTLWISMGLALSFALYGLVRKLTPVAPMRGLGAETVILAPLAIAYLVWLNGHGGMMFGTDLRLSLLLAASALVTALPLLLFAMAAQRLPMVTLGLMQYIAPSLLFLTGIFLFGETLNQAQLYSFMLIWLGLILFSIDSLRAMRSARLATA